MFVDLMTDIRSTLTDRLFKAQMMPAQPLRAPQITRMSGPTLDTTDEGYAPGAAAVTAGRAFAPTGVAASARADLGAAAPLPTGTAASVGVAARAATAPMTARSEAPGAPPALAGEKVGRNDPCPCGSGKKYKKCHGRPGAPPL